MLMRRRPSDSHSMPQIIIECRLGVRPHPSRSIPEIEDIVQVSVHQLDCHEVLAFAAVVQYKTVGLHGLELEVQVESGVGAKLGKAKESELGLEGDRVVDDVVLLAEFRRHLVEDDWDHGY